MHNRRVDLCDIGRIGFNHGFVGHVAGEPVAEARDHFDAGFLARAWHRDLVRHNFKGGDVVLGGIPERNALRNPVENRFVVRRVGVESQSATMRYLLSRLGEHQAARWIRPIEPASGQIVKQSLVIELRIVSSERKLEPVLPLRRAMARAGRATRLIKDRSHVAEECHRLGRQRNGNATEQQKSAHYCFSPRAGSSLIAGKVNATSGA
jgi:hypothetical protein